MNLGRCKMMSTSVKCVVFGDAEVGKTSLLVAYATNTFTANYEPTVFQTYEVTVEIGKKKHTLALFDTAGKEEYAHLRALSCPQTNIFLVCFSLTSHESMVNARDKWVPYVKEKSPHTPFYLVGSKLDQRDDPDVRNRQVAVSARQGEKLARQLGAVDYIECSALTQKGIHRLFNRAIMTAIEPPVRKKKWTSCIG